MSVLGFELEWFDEVSGILQTLYLKFFLDDNTIEILKGTSTFLKRIFYPEVKLSDLFVGNSITVFNRLFLIKKFANKATTEYMNAREVRYLCRIGRDNLSQLGKLLIVAKNVGLVLGKVVTTSSSFYSSILAADQGDVVIELVGKLCTNRDALLKAIQVPSLSSVDAVMASAQEIEDALRSCGKASFRSQNCTLCLVKPHIMKSQTTGELLNAVTASGDFQIKAVFSIHMTLSMGEELFEVYRGLYHNYSAMLEHMCSTPVLAVLVTGTGSNADYEDIVSSFREFVGPGDPALAKVLRPESLRARFGESVVKNSVHCTDLPEDGEMECRYFFETLSSL
uniref:DM10 domain-containing protein n=1 Tax=Spumella elongata TaxID=89044 RepID=A0A7S3GT03_9STRA